MNDTDPNSAEVERIATVIEKAWGNPQYTEGVLRPIDRTIARAIIADDALLSVQLQDVIDRAKAELADEFMDPSAAVGAALAILGSVPTPDVPKPDAFWEGFRDRERASGVPKLDPEPWPINEKLVGMANALRLAPIGARCMAEGFEEFKRGSDGWRKPGRPDPVDSGSLAEMILSAETPRPEFSQNESDYTEGTK